MLAEDLHLSVTWDEPDDYDQNLVTWRFPEALEVDGDAERKWEDVEDEDDDEEGEGEDEESNAAMDRVLKKYGKVQVMDDDEGGGFDAV
jgi:5'-3' exoribonuclease 1